MEDYQEKVFTSLIDDQQVECLAAIAKSRWKTVEDYGFFPVRALPTYLGI